MFMTSVLHQEEEMVVELKQEGCQASDHSSSLCFNICKWEATGWFQGDLVTSPVVFVVTKAGILSQNIFS